MFDLPPFEVLSDGDKIAFLIDALAEANEALIAANDLNKELHAMNGELLAAIMEAKNE